jgi:hypothetical protein
MHKALILLVLVALASETSITSQAHLEKELLFHERIKAESGIIEDFDGRARATIATPSPKQQRIHPAFAAVARESMLEPGGRRSNYPQRADADFNVRVARPAYVNRHPKVLFDEAHNNTDTATGRYRPFVELVANDGYSVTPGTRAFSKSALNAYQVLVIVNALGPQSDREASPFTGEECDVVRAWVSAGGGLVLITDNAPFSAAMGELSKRFGVDLTVGYTIDKIHYNRDSEDETELLFTRQDGLISDHAITRGRDATEQINRVVTFTGTSLKGPEKSVPFLKLAETAMDVVPPTRNKAASNEPAPDYVAVSAAGRAQGVALEFGKGRVVVLSEAAMLTAQVTTRGVRFGMNVSGIDNRQLALNIMHWLSGSLK